MKKPLLKLLSLVFLLCFLVMTNINLSGQGLLSKGDIDLHAGIGLVRTFYTGGYYTSGVPPISFSADYGLLEDIGIGNIGVGGFFGYTSFKYEYSGWGGTWGYKYSVIMIGARGTYHFDLGLPDKIDLYGVFMPYFRTFKAKETGTAITGVTYNSLDSEVSAAILAGAKYFFTDNLAVWTELGYGIAWLNFGLTFRL